MRPSRNNSGTPWGWVTRVNLRAVELFPVSFTLDGTQYRKCKVIADAQGATIYQWNPRERTAEAVYSTDQQPEKDPAKRDTYTVGELSVVKGCTPCGGGGALAKWKPTPGVADRVQAT